MKKILFAAVAAVTILLFGACGTAQKTTDTNAGASPHVQASDTVKVEPNS